MRFIFAKVEVIERRLGGDGDDAAGGFTYFLFELQTSRPDCR
jgi:hypothetical protein